MQKFFTRLLAALAILAAAVPFAQAQDIHFSQFYASPLTLNPALTGNVNGGYRAAIAYRNQWASIPAPYSTVAASFDMSLMQCQLGGDNVGVGVALTNDRSGDGALNDFSGLLSVAYHKALDAEGRFRLGAGVQGGYTQKSVDFKKLYFESQIDYTVFGFDPNLPNLEQINDNTFHYFDFRAGGLFTASPTDRISAYLGGAFYHITKPEESFLYVANDNALASRMVFHAGSSISITDKFSISPSAMYMSQSSARQLIFGAAFGYHFNQDRRYRRRQAPEESSAVYIGGWYRLNDAVVALLGVDYKGVKFGLSYDINISELDVASLNQGGVELSLSYTARGPECKKKQPLYCPRF